MKTLSKMIFICLLCTVYSCNNNQVKKENKNIIIQKTEKFGRYYEYKYYREQYKDTMCFYFCDSTFKKGDNVSF
jgi:hypothetical protein